MTKKNRGRPRSGVTAEEFDDLVDEEFREPTTSKRKGGGHPMIQLTDAEYEQFAAAGFDPRLRSRTAGAFNAVLSKCLGVPVSPLSQDHVDFLNRFDTGCRELMHARGLAIREDDD